MFVHKRENKIWGCIKLDEKFHDLEGYSSPNIIRIGLSNLRIKGMERAAFMGEVNNKYIILAKKMRRKDYLKSLD